MKPKDFLKKHGYTSRSNVADGRVFIFKDGVEVASLSGSELSVNNTPQITIEILKAKLNL